MEIVIVVIIVLSALILAVVKLRRIITGKETSCSCSGKCPFTDDLTKCPDYRNTCNYFEKDVADKKEKNKSENIKKFD